MTVSMETERWTSKHAWRRKSNFVYGSYPAKYDWECSRCGKYEMASRPSASECPGYVDSHTNKGPSS